MLFSKVPPPHPPQKLIHCTILKSDGACYEICKSESMAMYN